jgi:hypothetical protein
MAATLEKITVDALKMPGCGASNPVGRHVGMMNQAGNGVELGCGHARNGSARTIQGSNERLAETESGSLGSRIS